MYFIKVFFSFVIVLGNGTGFTLLTYFLGTNKQWLVFEEPEDPSNRSFFSEIISSISGIRFSNDGRFLISRDYLSVKVWDLNMDTRPVETYQVHEYLRSKLCSLYENDYIFDKFECCFGGNDQYIMTGSYNNFFKIFNRLDKREVMLEASREIARPRTVLKPRKVSIFFSSLSLFHFLTSPFHSFMMNVNIFPIHVQTHTGLNKLFFLFFTYLPLLLTFTFTYTYLLTQLKKLNVLTNNLFQLCFFSDLHRQQKEKG